MIRNSMKNTIWGMCACAFFLTSMATISRAQGVVPGSHEISVNFGSTDQNGVDGKKHVDFGAAYSENFTKHFVISVEMRYQDMGSLDGVKGSYFKGGGAVRYNLGSNKTLVPFVVADFGDVDEFASGSGVSTSAQGYYVGGGGGVNVFLTKNLGVRGDYRAEEWGSTQTGSSSFRVGAYGGAVFLQWGGRTTAK